MARRLVLRVTRGFIGVDVFERDASFDPASDSIVRVQVNPIGRQALRKLLERVDAVRGAFIR